MKKIYFLVAVVILGLLFSSLAFSGNKLTVTILENAVKGGKNSQVVDWYGKILPKISEKTGINIKLIPAGIKDEDYKARLALDIKGGKGPDIIGFDHFWVPEFAAAKYLLSLDDFVSNWSRWNDYYGSMKKMGSYKGHTYLVMKGTDVRMIYYNKELFEKAGISVPWQPKNWDELLNTARILKKKLPGVIPLQIDAGTEMGEATTMQGFYMVLLGAGGKLYDWKNEKWIIESPALLDTLKFYKTVYIDEKLGDANLQVSPKAREKSFELYRDGKIAMYVEGTWMYTSVMKPGGAWGIPDRDAKIGWAAMPGSGKSDTPKYVSISGGGGWVINPNLKNKEAVFKVFKEMLAVEPQVELFKIKPFVPPSKDLAENPIVKKDKFISETSKLLVPYTTFRPGFPEYPEISFQAQLATERVVTGQMSPEDAMKEFAKSVTEIVGKDKVEEIK